MATTARRPPVRVRLGRGYGPDGRVAEGPRSEPVAPAAVRRDDGSARVPAGRREGRQGREVTPNRDPWVVWVEKHPRAMVWLLFVSTCNLVMNVLEAAKVI